MTREEIVKAVTEPESITDTEKKTVVISSSSKADFAKIAKSHNLEQGTKQYQIIHLFCEEKKATSVDARVLVKRIQGLSDEQLKIIEMICFKREYTVKDILEFVQSIKKFGTERILALRVFADIDGVGPGPLNQFFTTTLVKGQRGKIGEEAYTKEVKEKMMTPDQVNVFYNICSYVEDITPRTAISLLPKVRLLKQQHAQFINVFFKKGAFFGDQPIDDETILGFVNLWLSLPEVNDPKTIKKLIKKLSRQSQKKNNFQYLIHAFKEATGKEKPPGKIATGIRNFWG